MTLSDLIVFCTLCSKCAKVYYTIATCIQLCLAHFSRIVGLRSKICDVIGENFFISTNLHNIEEQNCSYTQVVYTNVCSLIKLAILQNIIAVFTSECMYKMYICEMVHTYVHMQDWSIVHYHCVLACFHIC